MGSLRGFEGNIKDENGNIIGYGPISFEEGINQIILPDLAQQATFIGVQKLGVQLGLDPQQARLAALPLSISVGGAARGNDASSIGKAISSGLASGITSIALGKVFDSGDPFNDAVTMRTVQSGMEGFLTNPLHPVVGMFKGIWNGTVESVTNVLTFDADKTDFVRQQAELIDFGQMAKEIGLEKAMDIHAASIFRRDTLESIFKQGGLKDLLTGQHQVIIYDGTVDDLRGQEVKKIYLDGKRENYMIVSKDGERLIAKKEGNLYLEASRWAIDPSSGRFGVVEGRAVITHGEHLTTEETIQGGKILRIEGIEDGESTFYIIPRRGEEAVRMSEDGSFDGELVNLVGGDFALHMEFNKGVFEEVRLAHQARALTAVEMEAITQEMQIEAGRFIEITPAQKETDRGNFIEYVNEVEVKLVEKLGAEKAAAVVNDLRQAGQSLIEDPSRYEEVKDSLHQKTGEVNLSQEEWKSVAEIVSGVAKGMEEKAIQMGADGNMIGGFLIYAVGGTAEFFVDPLRVGEGFANATVAANQGHYGEAALYTLQDVLRVVTVVPALRVVAKSGIQAIDDVASGAKTFEEVAPVAKNAQRFWQSVRNWLNPFNKAYDIEGKTLILGSKGDDVLIKSGTLDDVATGFKKGVIPSETTGRVKVTKTAEEVNERLRSARPDLKDPYKPGTMVNERISTTIESDYVRVWTEGQGKATGNWIVKKSEVQGLTPEQIKDALGLKDVPTRVADVHVPGGFKLREGIIAEVPEWGSKGGKIQTEVLDDVFDDMFINSREIGEVLK